MIPTHKLRRMNFVRSTSLYFLILVVVATTGASTVGEGRGGQRESLLFDYGWKFRTGLTDWAAPHDPPPTQIDPGRMPPESNPDYDDSTWWTVQLPHDGLILNGPSKEACGDGCSGRSFIPRHVMWYRNSFSLPNEWMNSVKDDGTSRYNNRSSSSIIDMEFEGSFRNTTVWLNGELVMNHVCGYTPFRIPLDASRKDHTVAVFVDPDNGDAGSPSSGSGWWYEGGGLYRHVRLVKTGIVRTQRDSLFVKSTNFSLSSPSILVPPDSKDGTMNQTSLVTLEMRATVLVGRTSSDAVCCFFEVVHPDGSTLGRTKWHRLLPHRRWTKTNETLNVKDDESVLVEETYDIVNPELWTSVEPNLYQIDFVLKQCGEQHRHDNEKHDGEELDRVSVHHGIRKIHFDPNYGFFLNDQRYKIRGFCDHDTFAVVGMALPDRINLFRAQASRSIGGNGRRTSHNPPDPTLLDIYDRLGMVVIDENRLFADNPAYVQNMMDLVERDRNHPSVIIWSFCNENGCEGAHEQGGPSFQAVTTILDGTRPTLANMFTFNDLLSNTVDVQGFSHSYRDKLDKCHATLPNKPILMSECCSCNTMRGEDEGCETLHDNPHSSCNQKAFNGRCLEKLVNVSDGVDYSAGTMVWTLFDYYGEPPSAGLTVSSTYGQFDLCGFPKSAAFWFRSQWLLGVSDDRLDKPFPTFGAHEVHLVESWESPDHWNATKGNKTKVVHAYANAPLVELFVNGITQGSRTVVPMVQGPGSYAEWETTWVAGAITAVARSANGTVLSRTTKLTHSGTASLQLSLDCPSEATGTGRALFLDGQDVALVRATIVDSKTGQIMHLATNNVTFSVVSGPGIIQGTANGDPKSYQPHTSTSQTAYHGLVRAVVRVASIAGLPSSQKELLQRVHGSNIFGNTGPSLSEEEDIVIEATSPGFEPARLQIPTSTDPSTSVLEVAAAGAGQPVDFFSSPKKTTQQSGLLRGDMAPG